MQTNNHGTNNHENNRARSRRLTPMALLRATLLAAVVGSVAVLLSLASPAQAKGSEQVSGVGFPGAPGTGLCDDAGYLDADYAIGMTGDLEGCVYGYIVSSRYQEKSGTYQEVANETFVGNWGHIEGTFDMLENFTAKFDPETGAQIFGRCKHPIVRGSGTGDFAGVTGRLDYKDNVDAGTADYKGHLKLVRR